MIYEYFLLKSIAFKHLRLALQVASQAEEWDVRLEEDEA